MNIKIKLIISYEESLKPCQDYEPYDHTVCLNWNMPIPRKGERIQLDYFIDEDSIHIDIDCEFIVDQLEYTREDGFDIIIYCNAIPLY